MRWIVYLCFVDDFGESFRVVYLHYDSNRISENMGHVYFLSRTNLLSSISAMDRRLFTFR